MSRVSVKSLVLSGAVFCLALYNVGAGLPTAQASCGDYVHLRGLAAAGETPMIQPARTPHHETATPNHPRPDHLPCNGPHCRQQPPAPSVPVPAPATQGQPQKACLTESTVGAVERSVRLPSESDREAFKPGSTRIERPPRRS